MSAPSLARPLDAKIASLFEDHPDVGFTSEDIAALCGCAVATVSTTISGLRKLGINPAQRRVYTMRGWKTGAQIVNERERRAT